MCTVMADTQESCLVPWLFNMALNYTCRQAVETYSCGRCIGSEQGQEFTRLHQTLHLFLYLVVNFYFFRCSFSYCPVKLSSITANLFCQVFSLLLGNKFIKTCSYLSTFSMISRKTISKDHYNYFPTSQASFY